jgi:hypothetical protein
MLWYKKLISFESIQGTSNKEECEESPLNKADWSHALKRKGYVLSSNYEFSIPEDF